MARVRSAVDAAATVVERCLEGEFIPAGHEAGQSSVDKYLEEKAVIERELKPTGVAQYLDDRVDTVKEIPVSTGVELYLEERAVIAKENAVSGVEKYLASQKQTIESEKVPDELVLIEDVEEAAEIVVATGVDKYLQSKPEAVTKAVELTGVDKYMEKQSILAKEVALANATGVERYLMSAAS